LSVRRSGEKLGKGVTPARQQAVEVRERTSMLVVRRKDEEKLRLGQKR
jgi:hypothetical protein